MRRRRLTAFVILVMICDLAISACTPAASTSQPGGLPRVLAAETFLADIAQNVAGDRLHVESLLPAGVDPHSFEPTPGDVTRVAQSTVLIVNGAGLEVFAQKLVQNAGGKRDVIEASAGLAPRTSRPGELPPEEGTDPHFWLNPLNVVTYTLNIRDGLSRVDPAGAAAYAANAETYVARLKDLDKWVADQVSRLPQDRRVLVTNHETLGYYADHYGFRIVGTVIPSVSTEASPSAQQLAQLVNRIKASGARAIFLEVGTNPQLAQQVAQETGARVVTDLYTHSTSPAGGPAPSYIDMIKYNTRVIVQALSS